MWDDVRRNAQNAQYLVLVRDAKMLQVSSCCRVEYEIPRCVLRAYRATKLARSELAVGHNLVGHKRSDFLYHVERYAIKRFNESPAAAYAK